MKLKDVIFKNQNDEIHIELSCNKQYCGLCYFGLVNSSNWKEKSHSLTNFEFLYIAKGAGLFSVNNKFQKVEQGHCLIMRPGETYKASLLSDSPFQLYYFGFDLKYIPSLEIDYYNIGENNIFKDNDEFIKQGCEALLTEFRNMKFHSEDMIKGIVLQMLVTILRMNPKMDTNSNGSVIKTEIKRAIIEIQTNKHTHIDINELAKRLNYSRSHLEREFKQEIGIPIGKYTRELRLEEAKNSLRYTTNSITSISETLAFDSIHKFSLFFKRHTGYSPEKYRKEMMKKYK